MGMAWELMDTGSGSAPHPLPSLHLWVGILLGPVLLQSPEPGRAHGSPQGCGARGTHGSSPELGGHRAHCQSQGGRRAHPRGWRQVLLCWVALAASLTWGALQCWEPSLAQQAPRAVPPGCSLHAGSLATSIGSKHRPEEHIMHANIF